MQMEIRRHFAPRRGIQEKCNLSIDKVGNHCYNNDTFRQEEGREHDKADAGDDDV